MLAFLGSAASYAHRPKSVTVLQTHVSYVALAGAFVYKVKKPVNLGFADFSTLEKRRHFTHREVELNRLLCPAIYLGVVPIVWRGNTLAFADGASGDIVDYAVRMHRLDERFLLRTLIEAGTVTTGDLDRVAAVLASFCLRQARGPAVLAFGQPAQIRDLVETNLKEAAPFVDRVLSNGTYTALQLFFERWLKTHAELLAARVRLGRIYDGHGDLRPEHIHLGPHSVCIFDCVEFNDRFRCCDAACDLAFLAMELDFAQRRDLTRYFVQRMTDALSDPQMAMLLPFYQCYRAVVRGKVSAIAADASEFPETQRAPTRDRARRYMQLALTYAVTAGRPLALAIGGRIATGKSTLANGLAECLGWRIISSDWTRKELAGLPPTERPSPEVRKTLYTPSMSERTYRKLFESAAAELREGRSVILDATFGRRTYRDQLAAIASSNAADRIFIELTCPDEWIRTRLQERDQQSGVTSDARLEDFDQVGTAYQEPSELGADGLIRADGTVRLGEQILTLLCQLIEQQFESRKRA